MGPSPGREVPRIGEYGHMSGRARRHGGEFRICPYRGGFPGPLPRPVQMTPTKGAVGVPGVSPGKTPRHPNCGPTPSHASKYHRSRDPPSVQFPEIRKGMAGSLGPLDYLRRAHLKLFKKRNIIKAIP